MSQNILIGIYSRECLERKGPLVLMDHLDKWDRSESEVLLASLEIKAQQYVHFN